MVWGTVGGKRVGGKGGGRIVEPVIWDVVDSVDSGPSGPSHPWAAGRSQVRQVPATCGLRQINIQTPVHVRLVPTRLARFAAATSATCIPVPVVPDSNTTRTRALST